MTGASEAEAPAFEISDPARLAPRPLVSVLVLTYNHERYLAQAVESVLSQEHDFPIEIIVGEDCSSDRTRDIAIGYQRRHPDLVRVITSERNVGVLENYRRILIAARGSLLAQLDGDDAWLPGKLARQVKVLLEETGCAAVYANARTVTEDGRPVGVFNDAGDLCCDLGALLRHGNFLCTSSMVFRAELRDSLALMERPYIDFLMHLRAARSGYLRHLAEPLALYRINSSGSVLAQHNDHIRRCYWEALQDVPPDAASATDRARGGADFLRRVLFRAIRTRRPGLLREWVLPVYAASPKGRWMTTWFVAEAVARAAWRESTGYLAVAFLSRTPVLYRQ